MSRRSEHDPGEFQQAMRRFRQELTLIKILIVLMAVWLVARVIWGDVGALAERIATGILTVSLAILGIVHAFTFRKINGSDIDRIHFLTMHDELTSLYNLRYLKSRLDEEILRSERYSHPFCVLFIDLDNMKRVNDTYGHKVGDEVLKTAATVMKETCRATDLLGRAVGRVGGDEFLVILPETGLLEGCGLAARLVAAGLAAAVSCPDGSRLSVRFSIGVALYPEGGSDREQLLETADAAMYRAKHSGGSCYADFQGNVGRASAADELPPLAPG